MAGEVSDLLKKALALPPEARAALADSLLESLDGEPPDEGVEAAWSEEIKRRIEEIDSGKAKMIPYEEVRRRLLARLSDARKRGDRRAVHRGWAVPRSRVKRRARRRGFSPDGSAKTKSPAGHAGLTTLPISTPPASSNYSTGNQV
jgi:putative addiction module component (TIGR02574 family)